MSQVLITGSSGLVGRRLQRELQARGHRTRGFDLRAAPGEYGDICDASAIATAMLGVEGIVHLAAVSRVVWAERDPVRTWRTNVDALDGLLQLAMSPAQPPWLLFASSREVYGESTSLPVHEDGALRPVNVYGRSKVAGERLVHDASNRGLRAAVVRLSNVYGCALDHPDRVVPAFARAAAAGLPLRVEGERHTFDFTHVDDVVRGMADVVAMLDRGGALPTIQFVSGTSTTLGELASLAVNLGGRSAAIEPAPEREFDVSSFRGSPARARALLSWSPRVDLREGMTRLIRDFRDHIEPDQAGMETT